MDFLNYINKNLHFDQKDITDLLEKYPTPFYLYSETAIISQFHKFQGAAIQQEVPNPLVCFALKANPNPSLLKSLFSAGSGADIVSGGELKRALDNGCDPMKIVFSGVGKTDAEIIQALNASVNGIYSFNVESTEEAISINKLAGELGKIARIAFRVNPKVHAKTHRHISTGFKTHKFGILKEDILEFSKDLKKYPHIKVVGLSVHIGSQLTKLKATKKAVKEVLDIANALDSKLEFIDVGGGLGVDYEKNSKTPSVEKYMKGVAKILKDSGIPRVVFEPGRFICAGAGIFLTKVIRTKVSDDCEFAIVDGGMNDFVRTSLYEAYHEIIPVSENDNPKIKMDIVGPVCETACSFASGRRIQKLKANDFVAVLDVGAYGHAMSSTYNLRKRPNEYVLKAGGLIETFEY